MIINLKKHRRVKNDEKNKRGDVDREGYPIDSSRYGVKQFGFSKAFRPVPKKPKPAPTSRKLLSKTAIAHTLRHAGWTKIRGLWKSPHVKRQLPMTFREAATIERISAPPHCFE